MGTTIRPEVSKRNPYALPKHRYYELVHFCLQYPEWKAEYNRIMAYQKPRSNEIPSSRFDDPTSSAGLKLAAISEKIEKVETACFKADSILGNYILMSVTEGKSFEQLNAKYNIPCCKNYFYDKRRKALWLLNKTNF